MIKVIIFDFDGVLVDSNRLKHEAWFRLFEGVPNVTPDLVSDSLIRVRETRYDILRDIFTKIGMPSDRIEPLVTEYAAKFNDVVQQGILSDGLIPEVMTVLPSLSLGYPLYINSATPQEPLIQTVENIGLSPFFKGVYGKPASKEKNLLKIFSAEGITASEAVFIGDADSDHAATVNTACHFIGVPNEFNGWTDDRPFPLLSNMAKIQDAINKLT